MRMTRYLVLAVAPVALLASCDPFDLFEPRQPRPLPRHPDQRENLPDRNQLENEEQRPNPDNRPVLERYPVAERTANPNQVLSPFPPYNVIDVTGFNSGQLARDPSNNEIFRIP